MKPTNPESMTTDERTTELASIFALGLVRAVRSARLRISPSSSEVSQSSPEALEDRQDDDLSVLSLGSITGSERDQPSLQGSTP